MSVYSTGWVTFRLWHLFLFRYHVWFLSNQLAPFPLTSPIREPAYYTSRTGQTEINLGQISAWGNFNEGKKKKKWYKNNSEGFCSRQFCLCTSRMRSSSQSFKAGVISGIIPTPSLYSNEPEAQRLNDLVQGRTLKVKPSLESWCQISFYYNSTTIWMFIKKRGKYKGWFFHKLNQLEEPDMFGESETSNIIRKKGVLQAG